ncbi:MAG: hypothetical protein JWM82_598 [Myxococcales bacterium]|nr:hypothetical protein [Myxococcales bacterium]
MKLSSIVVLAVIGLALFARPADAKIAALYASGQGGVQQNGAANNPGMGFEVGARLLVFDGYLDYLSLGQNQSIARGVLGLRAGFGNGDLRLVLRAGVGGIRDYGGALAGDRQISGSRLGGVARAGIGLDARIDPLLYVGFTVDAETFIFPRLGAFGTGSEMGSCSCQEGSDIFAALRLTFEVGI